MLKKNNIKVEYNMKYLLTVLLVALLISCSDKPVFSEKVIEKNTENCEDDCLSINLNYLFCEKPNKFAINFNNEIQSQVVNFLLSNQTDSLKVSNISISESIDIFMKDYSNIHNAFPDITPYELILNDSISF